MKKKTKKDLKSFNAEIQVCPECRKVDVYLNDGHECDYEYQMARQQEQDLFYK